MLDMLLHGLGPPQALSKSLRAHKLRDGIHLPAFFRDLAVQVAKPNCREVSATPL